MDGNTSKIATDEFAFAGVNAAAQFYAKRPYGVPECAGTPDGSSRPIKRGKKSISGRADLASSIELQYFADLGEKLVQQFAPGIVSNGCDTLGRSNDVCKEHSREQALWLPGILRSRKEPFYCIENCVAIA